MKGPYTTVLRSSRDVLDTVAQDGVLRTHLGFAQLAAAQWVMAGIVDAVDLETIDSKGTNVRSHVVFTRKGGDHTKACDVVMQRLS